MFRKLVYKLNELLVSHYQKGCQKNLVYFESFHGKKYSDNPKAIYKYIKENHPEYECVWGVKKGYEDIFKEEGISYVLRFSPKWYKLIARANFWVVNTRTKTWLPKASYTKYIETWHGTPLKHIGLDILDAKIGNQSADEYQKKVREETRMWDVVLSSSTYTSNCFKSAFALTDEQILETGYPRNDKLINFDNDKSLAFKDQLGLSGKRIILYAPTWREDSNQNKAGYEFNLPFSLDQVAKSLGKNEVFALRMHYLVSQYIVIPDELKDKIINVSDNYDMADLLEVSDALITDYSSSFFDYALLERPMLFYLPDRKHYEKELRGLYLSNLEDVLPGKIVETQEEFYQALKDLSKKPDLAKFRQQFNNYEQGDAAKQVVLWMQSQEEV